MVQPEDHPPSQLSPLRIHRRYRQILGISTKASSGLYIRLTSSRASAPPSSSAWLELFEELPLGNGASQMGGRLWRVYQDVRRDRVGSGGFCLKRRAMRQ